MELKARAESEVQQQQRSLKRPRGPFDDEHWQQFFEEVAEVTEDSYRTIRSFEIFKAEYLGLQIQQSSLEETNGSMLRRLRDNALGDRSSKGFKRMLGTPTKKMKLEESQPTGTQSSITEKKVFKPILINGSL